MVKFLILAAAAAMALPADPPSDFDYDACLAKVTRHPDDALEMAMNAQRDGEDASAEHCAAVALINLRQYNEAARRLDKLARKGSAGGAETRAQIMDQAGNAWILAGQPELATASFTAALALMPSQSEYLIDRARASAMLKKWPTAETDLSAALIAEPGSTEALVLRASARRAQRNFQGAMGDVTQALILDPNYPEGLVERGLLRAQRGDKAGARKDFLRVLEIAGDPDHKVADTAVDAARSARHEIEKLELTDKSGPKLKVQVKNN
jgi:tetratricopeptide (TPR) repeat protein